MKTLREALAEDRGRRLDEQEKRAQLKPEVLKEYLQAKIRSSSRWAVRDALGQAAPAPSPATAGLAAAMGSEPAPAPGKDLGERIAALAQRVYDDLLTGTEWNETLVKAINAEEAFDAAYVAAVIEDGIEAGLFESARSARDAVLLGVDEACGTLKKKQKRPAVAPAK